MNVLITTFVILISYLFCSCELHAQVKQTVPSTQDVYPNSQKHNQEDIHFKFSGVIKFNTGEVARRCNLRVFLTSNEIPIKDVFKSQTLEDGTYSLEFNVKANKNFIKYEIIAEDLEANYIAYGFGEFNRQALAENEIVKVINLILGESASRFDVSVVDKSNKPVPNATVVVQRSNKGSHEYKTNKKGTVSFLRPMPYLDVVDNICVYEKSKGIDNIHIPSQLPTRDQPYMLSPNRIIPSYKINLRLDNFKEKSVKIVNEHKKPIPGLKVSFDVNLQEMSSTKLLPLDLLDAVTDEQGIATCKFIPYWSIDSKISYRVDDESQQYDGNFPIPISTNVATIPEFTLNKFVAITGTVTYPDGSPAESINVGINTAQNGIYFAGETKTDQNGKYSFGKIRKNTLVMLTIQDPDWSANPYLGIKADFDDLEGKDFRLNTKTRLTGTVTLKKPLPVKNPKVYFTQYGFDFTNRALIADRRTPFPSTEQFCREYTTVVDDNGNYEIFLGPGSYEVKIGDYSGRFATANRLEIQYDIIEK